MAEELKYCPQCNFDKKAFEKHKNDMRGHIDVSWDYYKPVILKSVLFKQWFVECQNCEMTIMFSQNSEELTIKRWNELPRKND